MNVIRRGILNTLQATAGDLYIDTSNAKQWGLVADGSSNSANPVSCLFEPIPLNKVLSITTQASVAEVPQIKLWTPGANALATPTPLVVAAGKRYMLKAAPAQKKLEKAPKEYTFAYTAPATLTGTAQTDRDNMYVAMRNKINAANAPDFRASVLYYFAVTAGVSGNAPTAATVGAVITQGTSNITAKLARFNWKTGAAWVGAITADCWIYDPSSTSFNATAVNWTATTPAGVFTQAAAAIIAVGLALVDNSGYFTSSIDRGGITFWSDSSNATGYTQQIFNPAYSTAAATVVEVLAAYPVGIGTVMLAQKAFLDLDKRDVISGAPELILNADPVAGTTYETWTIVTRGEWPATDGKVEYFEKTFVVYLSEANSTNLTNLRTAVITTNAASIFA